MHDLLCIVKAMACTACARFRSHTHFVPARLVYFFANTNYFKNTDLKCKHDIDKHTWFWLVVTLFDSILSSGIIDGNWK